MMKISEYLKSELNTSSLSNKEQIASQFERVADHLLKRCMLTIDDRIYLLSEIEFYYYSDIHPDPYVHRHPNQLKSGQWYFHNVGQDLTFGSEGCYGGILIRGIATNNELIFTGGPVKTFDELFNKGIYSEKQTKMEMNCEYSQFPEFLYALSQFERLFVVSNVKLQKMSQDPNRVTVNLTLKTYLLN